MHICFVVITGSSLCRVWCSSV